MGDTPYVLVVASPEPTAIDLDEPGWATKYAHLMREPGRWILALKAGSVPVLTMTVKQGEQPYYTSRVFGTATLPPPDALGMTQDQMLEVRHRSEVRAYGIGKKRLDGHVDRMWILPTGTICTGDDVDVLGSELAKARLFALLRSRNNGPDGQGHQPGDEVHRPEAEGQQEAAGNGQEDG